MSDIFDYLMRERESLHDYALEWPGIKKRQWKSQYATVEMMLLEKFNKRLLDAPKIEIQGYASRIGGRKFILRPSLSLDTGVVCDAGKSRYLPSEFEFVQVEGYRTQSSAPISILASNEIAVENVSRLRPSNEIAKQEVSIRDAQDALLEGYVDVPSQLGRDLLISLTSSPADSFRIGGLTATLLPLEEQFVSFQVSLLNKITKTLPRDLTSRTTIETSIEGIGRFDITPFPWDALSSNSSSIQKNVEAVLARKNPEKALSEFSVGISADSFAPKSLDDIWMKYADLPSFVDTKFVVPEKPRKCSLDLAKYLIVAHLNRPTISPEVWENGSKSIVRRLVKLRKEYDSDGYSGMLDLDAVSGSPKTVWHIAEALARATGHMEVNETHVEEALTYFVDSRELLFKQWEDRDINFRSSAGKTRSEYLSPTEKRIYRFVTDHPNTTRAEIRENFLKVTDSVFDRSIQTLKEAGFIYRSAELDERYCSAE